MIHGSATIANWHFRLSGTLAIFHCMNEETAIRLHEMIAHGASAEEIAAALDLDIDFVRQIIEEERPDPDAPRPPGP